jgi:hypothetical protein
VLVADHRLTPLSSISFFTVMPAALESATGFSKAISFAPPSMPILMNGSRRWGMVQKQKTSGFRDEVNAAASVEVSTLGPSSAFASDIRASSMSQMPTTSNRSLALKAAV